MIGSCVIVSALKIVNWKRNACVTMCEYRSMQSCSSCVIANINWMSSNPYLIPHTYRRLLLINTLLNPVFVFSLFHNKVITPWLRVARSKQWSMINASQTESSQNPNPSLGSLQSELPMWWMELIRHGQWPMTHMPNSQEYRQGSQHSCQMALQKRRSLDTIRIQQDHALHENPRWRFPVNTQKFATWQTVMASTWHAEPASTWWKMRSTIKVRFTHTCQSTVEMIVAEISNPQLHGNTEWHPETNWSNHPPVISTNVHQMIESIDKLQANKQYAVIPSDGIESLAAGTHCPQSVWELHQSLKACNSEHSYLDDDIAAMHHLHSKPIIINDASIYSPATVREMSAAASSSSSWPMSDEPYWKWWLHWKHPACHWTCLCTSLVMHYMLSLIFIHMYWLALLIEFIHA